MTEGAGRGSAAAARLELAATTCVGRGGCAAARQIVGARSSFAAQADAGPDAEVSDSNSSDDASGDLPGSKRARVPAVRKRRQRRRLRSNHAVIDTWLSDESGDDNYADLEDFIVY